MDETLDKFHARLRYLAKKCNFHDVEREVRSQIVVSAYESTIIKFTMATSVNYGAEED